MSDKAKEQAGIGELDGFGTHKPQEFVMKTYQALSKIYFLTVYCNAESKGACMWNLFYFTCPS